MLGVFDSGAGGLISYRELRRLMPLADLIYLADRKNAPFGCKTEEEILRITENGLLRLCSMGAEKILIACCTASTVHDKLPPELQAISIPIITPTARECKNSRRVTVIATEHTAGCGAFRREIAKFSSAEVKEIAMQRLVSLIEWGGDRAEAVEQIAEYCRNSDTLILGCTHFSHLLTELCERLPDKKIISPAHLGAEKLTRIKISRENGLDIYTS